MVVMGWFSSKRSQAGRCVVDGATMGHDGQASLGDGVGMSELCDRSARAGSTRGAERRWGLRCS